LGTVVADKTGTIGGRVNDVGVIADIGRAVQDFYLFADRP